MQIFKYGKFVMQTTATSTGRKSWVRSVVRDRAISMVMIIFIIPIIRTTGFFMVPVLYQVWKSPSEKSQVIIKQLAKFLFSHIELSIWEDIRPVYTSSNFISQGENQFVSKECFIHVAMEVRNVCIHLISALSQMFINRPR